MRMMRGAWAAGRGCVAASLLLAALAAADVARAQDVVFDGERITAEDIDQRARFDLMATHKTPPRQQVIDELREEARAVGEARRRGIDIADADVDQAYANMAARMHMTAEQLTTALARQGIDARTLKWKIRADLAWAQSVRARMGLAPSKDQGLRLGPPIRPDPPTDLRQCLPCLPDNDALFRGN
jgi:peptidyl-prolyl cis-trans isomerase SurA